ncbi:TetR family transcriptional regulator [Arenibacter sp. F20364]|uniref:TetR family transcriptional regulator n=1 Tax=Arenibacter sp. F20364 TaxID=2926415 RepID=UPI001FF5E384|nr:TetR family transcriptional regulator [Arenibacter sp. F20364]MCK0191702.1 TetR family transcriptional regulator [Arenibacter sp. F20364]
MLKKRSIIAEDLGRAPLSRSKEQSINMGRKKLGPTRRLEIIKSFYEVAKQTGLENASIAKVADFMNISNGLVMHYFNTKYELLIGLNEYILEQHLNVMTTNSNGVIETRADLENLIRSLFSRKWNQYFDDSVFYSCYALIYRNEDFNNSFKQYLLKLHLVLKENFNQAKANKVISNTNIDELTKIIYALIDGAYYYLGVFDQNDEIHQRQQQIYIDHCLSLFKYPD